jgi:F-type H+-transporting ATPase subunit delta
MADSRIASRYAKALLDLGIEQNNLMDLFNDMSVIKEALSNRDFNLFVKSPIIKADKKQSVFRVIFGENINKTTLAFFDILTRKSREIYFPEIVSSFIDQYKKFNKITEVKLTTATPLGQSAIDSINKVLLESSVTDEKVEIETAVDADLIGGFVIELGDKLYDASVAHQLEQVKKTFLNN